MSNTDILKMIEAVGYILVVEEYLCSTNETLHANFLREAYEILDSIIKKETEQKKTVAR